MIRRVMKEEWEKWVREGDKEPDCGCTGENGRCLQCCKCAECQECRLFDSQIDAEAWEEEIVPEFTDGH